MFSPFQSLTDCAAPAKAKFFVIIFKQLVFDVFTSLYGKLGIEEIMRSFNSAEQFGLDDFSKLQVGTKYLKTIFKNINNFLHTGNGISDNRC